MKNKIIFVLLICGFNLNAQTPTYSPTTFLVSRQMQHGFNGYNGTNTITQGQTWMDLANQQLHVSSLQPNALRYPGGTVANNWNWRDGRFLKNYEITCGIPGLTLPQMFLNFNKTLLVFL